MDPDACVLLLRCELRELRDYWSELTVRADLDSDDTADLAERVAASLLECDAYLEALAGCSMAPRVPMTEVELVVHHSASEHVAMLREHADFWSNVCSECSYEQDDTYDATGDACPLCSAPLKG